VKFGLGLSVQHLPEEPQAARFREHRVDHLFAEVVVEPVGKCGRKSRRMPECKGDVGDGRTVGHSGSPAANRLT